MKITKSKKKIQKKNLHSFSFNKKLKLNKKGGFAEPILDYFATVIIFMIIIIFFLLFYLHNQEIKVEITASIDELDSTIILQNYLRTPIEYKYLDEDDDDIIISKETITIAEYIDRMKDYEDPNDGLFYPLKSKTEEYLKPFEEMTGCPLKIEIIMDTERPYEFGPMINKVQAPCIKKKIKHYSATQYIPTKNYDKIEIVLKRTLSKSGK
jgi:hypothetical protein